MKFISLTDYDVVGENYFTIYIQAEKIVKITPSKNGSYVETLDGRTHPVKEEPKEIIQLIYKVYQ